MLEVGPTESRMIPVLVWLCKSTAGLVREARRSKAPCDFPHPTPTGVLRSRARAERFPCGVNAATSTSDQLARSTRPLRPNRADLHIHRAGLQTRTPSRDTRIPPKMLASPSSTPLDHSGDNSSATMPSILPAYTVPDNSIRISIDRGGTFTDVHTSWPDASGERQEQVLKLLSVDPSNYADAPTEACRRVLELATGQRYPRGVKLDTSKFDYIRCGPSLSLDLAGPSVDND